MFLGQDHAARSLSGLLVLLLLLLLLPPLLLLLLAALLSGQGASLLGTLPTGHARSAMVCKTAFVVMPSAAPSTNCSCPIQLWGKACRS